MIVHAVIVHKELGPYAPAIRALLRHLAAVGFGRAPRVAGDGFTYVPGESPHPRAWPDHRVGEVGAAVRDARSLTA